MENIPIPLLERTIAQVQEEAKNGIPAAVSFLDQLERRLKAAEIEMLRERLATLEDSVQEGRS